VKLSKEQNEVSDAIIDKLGSTGYRSKHSFSYSPFFMKISGYAGTGKTTLISETRERIAKIYPHLNIAFVTFTGKASSVLYDKLKQLNSVIKYEDYVGTIHGMIYKPVTRYDKQLKTFVIYDWELKEELIPDIIFIDEASMITKELWQDLAGFGKAIIAIGDNHQLPPIGDKFSLLDKPDFQLTEIQRQSLDSPIIDLSIQVRNEGWVKEHRFFSKSVFRLNWNDDLCKKIWNEKMVFDNNLAVLCGFNTTRCDLNKSIRDKKKIKTKIPRPGEQIVCLRNNHKTKIMNGQIGILHWVMPDKYKLYRMTVDIGSETLIECLVSEKCFGEATYTMYDATKESKRNFKYAISQKFDSVDFFDYGYVMSVHKAQGSEWDRVVVFEQRSNHWDDEYYARWLYTAITRARSKLFMISNYW